MLCTRAKARKGISLIKYGCLAHFDHLLADDIKFAKENGFTFLQVWYDKNGISLNKEKDPLESLIDSKFPFIIHAVLDITEMFEHFINLVEILKKCRLTDIIIHPVCKTNIIQGDANVYLSKEIKRVVEIAKRNNISVFLENNSKLDRIFSSYDEINKVLTDNPELNLLFDIAHMESYEQVKNIGIKYKPKLIHIADRDLKNVHEHLPIGKGNIDFNRVLFDLIDNREYKIILEIIESNEDIIKSKEIIDKIIKMKFA